MDHKDLDAWKKSMEIVVASYENTRCFPDEEKFGIISQIRRSAVSIPSNIAEGAARNHDKEFIQFLYISLGSLAELETQFLISVELSFIDKEVARDIFTNIELNRKLILGLIKYLKNKKK